MPLQNSWLEMLSQTLQVSQQLPNALVLWDHSAPCIERTWVTTVTRIRSLAHQGPSCCKTVSLSVYQTVWHEFPHVTASRRSQLAERLCYGRKHGLSGYVMFDYIDRTALSMLSCCHYCLGIFGHHGHCQHPRVCGHAFRYPFAIQWYGTTQQQSPNQLYIIIISWLEAPIEFRMHRQRPYVPMYTCIFRERERERETERQTERKEKNRKENKGKERKGKEQKGKERKKEKPKSSWLWHLQVSTLELNLDGGQGIGLVDSGGGKQLGISYTSTVVYIVMKCYEKRDVLWFSEFVEDLMAFFWHVSRLECHLASLHSPNLTWNCMLCLGSPNMNLWYGLKWMLFPRKSCNELFVYKITPRLTWNPTQAQTEPKLHPETANMEFERVITKRSETLKGDLKLNLEPKWFLRRGSCRFHVSDFRATLFFYFVLRSHLKNYAGSRSVVGKELKPKHLQEKVVTSYVASCIHQSP